MPMYLTLIMALPLLFNATVSGQDKTPASHQQKVGANWNQFRGPNGTGSTQGTNLPVVFSETTNLRWATEIHDVGWSSPVVWKQQVWVTTGRSDGRELFAVCVDLASGKIVHDIKVFDVALPQSENPKLNTHASPTPVIEKGRIYVHFGNPGTACLDTQTGEKLWERRDLKCDHRVRAASSPILDGDLLFLTFDGVDAQFVVALNKETGKTRWLQKREGQTEPIEFFRKLGFPDPEAVVQDKPNDNLKSYATPTVIEHEGRRQLISPAAEFTYSYDPQTGKELWRVRHRGMGFNVACRPMYANGLVYSTTGAAKRLLAVRPSGTGDVTGTHIAWVGRRAIPNFSSPLLVGELLFMVNDQGGVASCLEAKTGETVWKTRLGDGGSHWASPVHADGKIYFCSDEGDVAVITPAREFKKLAENQLNDGFMASPAIADDALLLRSRTHLYCFAKGATGGAGRVVKEKPKKTQLDAKFVALAEKLKAAVKAGTMTEKEAIAEWQRVIAEAQRGKGK